MFFNEDKVEVINVDNGTVQVVNINFYERNKDKLIPISEYYIKLPDSSVGINKARVEELMKYREEVKKEEDPKEEEETLEDLVDEAMKEAEEAIEAVKKVKAAKKRTTRKKTTKRK